MVGDYPCNEARTETFDATSQESILIHDVPEIMNVCTLAVYPKPPPSAPPLSFSHTPIDPNRPLIPAYLSWALLEGVARVEVFYAPSETNICRGLLLYYADGAERALGQCRVGVDACKTWVEPSYLCIRKLSIPRPWSHIPAQTVAVECARDPAHQHPAPGWGCSQMRGILMFWFNEEENFLNII